MIVENLCFSVARELISIENQLSSIFHQIAHCVVSLWEAAGKTCMLYGIKMSFINEYTIATENCTKIA